MVVKARSDLSAAVRDVLARAETGVMRPRFVVIGRRRKRLWLCCSACNRRLRRVVPDEEIDVTRAWFCDACDPGYAVRNRTAPGARAGILVKERQ